MTDDDLFRRNQQEAHARELQGIDHYLNSPEDDPKAMSADEMIEAWRQLLADGYSVEWKPGNWPTVYLYEPGSLRDCGHGEDTDPLRAFERAWKEQAKS